MIELRVLGCYGSESHGQHSSGYLLNGRVLLEAGSVTTGLPDKEQLEITHILISHAHLDHTKELIFLVDNFFNYGGRQLRLMGIPEVMDQLREHLFNDQVWPDFTRIPRGGEPVIQIEEMTESAENRVVELKVVPVRVNHIVAASGFIFRSKGSAMVYSGDTGPTKEIWRLARDIPELKAVIVETSFPDEQRELALESGHLTPALMLEELGKLSRPEVPVYVAHMKPVFADRIVEQLSALEGYSITPLEQGKTYLF
jgi:cAMP phosphodiesterase